MREGRSSSYKNGMTEDGNFQFHNQPFRFGTKELEGLRVFFQEPQRLPASMAEIAAGGVGNCISCHAAPNFTDFRFHNTGTTQIEYDSVHGAGSFSGLAIPDLQTRNSNHNAYLPATDRHPLALEPFRSIPSLTSRSLTDLGAWNIFANPDFPKPQPFLYIIFRQQFASTPFECTPSALLPKTIGVFKTPGLRDLSHSAPYMHTGQFDTLEDIIAFYRTTSDMTRAGVLRNGARELSGIALKSSDIVNLAAFLRSLNEDYE